MIRTALFLACLALPVGAVELTLPEGVELTVQRKTNPDRYLVPTGVFSAGALPQQSIDGKVSRNAWRVPSPNMTAFEILQPMRRQLLAAGYELVVDCTSAACGGFDFRFATEVLPGPNMYVNIREYHFVSALLPAEDGTPSQAITVLASTTATAAYVQIIRAGDFSTARRPTVVQARAIPQGDFAADLLASGHAILGDLVFDSGSSDLGAGPFALLDELAAFLKARPDIKVALVGHTDTVGGLAGNIALSKRRAQSVRRRLIRDYALPEAQIEAEGMGYLSPIASNLNTAGRDANRRVEVVLLSAAE